MTSSGGKALVPAWSHVVPHEAVDRAVVGAAAAAEVPEGGAAAWSWPHLQPGSSVITTASVQAYQPTPAQPTESVTTPKDPFAAPSPTDPGAAGPDEVLADSAEVPHDPTSIDSPLEEQILDPADTSDLPATDGDRKS